MVRQLQQWHENMGSQVRHEDLLCDTGLLHALLGLSLRSCSSTFGRMLGRLCARAGVARGAAGRGLFLGLRPPAQRSTC